MVFIKHILGLFLLAALADGAYGGKNSGDGCKHTMKPEHSGRKIPLMFAPPDIIMDKDDDDGFCYRFCSKSGDLYGSKYNPDWICGDFCDEVCDQAQASGDPHFTTFGGEKFDYHGACDLVLLKDPKFAHGLGLTVHIRTERRTWWSFIKAATVQIGEDTLEVMGGTGSISYWMNGGDKMELQTGDASLSDFPLHFQRVNDVHTRARIDLGNGDAIAVETFKDFVRVNIMNKSNNAFVGAAGLLGAFPHGAKVARDGVTVMEDNNAFGQEWQVRVAEPMLFHEVGPVQAHEECAMPDTTTSKGRRLGEGAITDEDAALACARVSEGDRDACIFDVMATQDKDMAGSY